MAQITLSSGSFMRPYRCPWGSAPMRSVEVSSNASTNVIYAGRMVVLDASTSGHRVKASTAAAGDEANIAGVAAEYSTLALGNKIAIWEANPMVEFQIHMTGGALADTHMGAARVIHWDSTLNVHRLGIADSTAAENRVIVTDFIDAVGDTNARVAVRFIRDLPAPSTVPSSVNYLAYYAR